MNRRLRCLGAGALAVAVLTFIPVSHAKAPPRPAAASAQDLSNLKSDLKDQRQLDHESQTAIREADGKRLDGMQSSIDNAFTTMMNYTLLIIGGFVTVLSMALGAIWFYSQKQLSEIEASSNRLLNADIVRKWPVIEPAIAKIMVYSALIEVRNEIMTSVLNSTANTINAGTEASPTRTEAVELIRALDFVLKLCSGERVAAMQAVQMVRATRGSLYGTDESLQRNLLKMSDIYHDLDVGIAEQLRELARSFSPTP